MAALTQLKRLVDTARSRYARLVLVSGSHGAGKTRLLKRLAAETGTTILNLGVDLPPELFDVAGRKRPVTAADALGDALSSMADPVIVDNIELLFAPELRLDPLKLFQERARNRVLVVSWPGSFQDNQLTFAGAGHPEHRTFASPDALVLALPV